jgi:tetratricopeptide (TPR) repeat protein
MIRPILTSALIGLVAGALAAHVWNASGRHMPGVVNGAAESGLSAAPIPGEGWPICSLVGSLAEGASWAALDQEFAAGKQALAAGDWSGAIRVLSRGALRDDRNAEIETYLGYAHFRLAQLDPAVKHFQRALTLDPRHRRAHEHLGEAHLMQGNPAKAQEHLAALERICLFPCRESDDLRQAIVAYDQIARR